MKNTEVCARQETEFLEAVQALHNEGDASPTMASVQEQILRERAAVKSPGRKLLYRAGVRLYAIDISEETTATRQRLENKGMVEAVQEASLLAEVYDRPPALLVRISQEPLIVR